LSTSLILFVTIALCTLPYLISHRVFSLRKQDGLADASGIISLDNGLFVDRRTRR
jgi:hypothetical protein